MIVGKAAEIATGEERQTLTLAGGEQISARLIVLANGLNAALRRNLGMDRRDPLAEPLDLDRLRRRPGRPPGIRLPGADLHA